MGVGKGARGENALQRVLVKWCKIFHQLFRLLNSVGGHDGVWLEVASWEEEDQEEEEEEEEEEDAPAGTRQRGRARMMEQEEE